MVVKVKKIIIKTAYKTPQKWNGKLSELPNSCFKKEEHIGAQIDDKRYVLDDGRIITLPGDLSRSIFEVKRTRNVSQKVKDAFAFAVDSCLKYEKCLKEAEEIRKKAMMHMADFRRTEDNIREAMGYLTRNDFITVFWNSLTESVRDEIKQKDYSLGECSGVCYRPKDIHISRSKDIQKYFRHASFIEEEYDGCVFIINEPEKDKNYMAYIKKYKQPLNIKAPYVECLSLGDKDWLTYECMYTIEVNEPLTKEYAERLAKEFCRR